jgi:PST family polysaccharide transporter
MWLARLLSPADYGVVAMALVVTNFATLVRDMGTGLALIQKENLNEETIQGLSRFLRTILLPTTLAGVMALVFWGCQELLPLVGFPPVVQLALLALVGAGTYAALGLAFARQSCQDVFCFFQRRRQRVIAV